MAARKYKVYKKQVSYDGGTTWIDVLPVETAKFPAYDEVCEIGYSAKRQITGYVRHQTPYWDVDGDFATIQPMHTLTKEYVDLLRFYDWNSQQLTREYWNGDIHSPLIIGKETEEIGASAFTDAKISSGQGVIFETPSKVKKIGACAFLNNTNWDLINIPDSVERIETRAFAASGFSRAMYVNIGTGCTYIGDEAFADVGYNYKGECAKIIRFSGSTPPELGNNAFGNKNAYGDQTLVVVPNNALFQYRSSWNLFSGDVISNISLGNSAKAETNVYGDMVQTPTGTTVVTDVYQLPSDGSNTLTYEDFTDSEDIKMSWLKIGDSVHTIPDSAFSGKCGNILYIDFGNGVETIGNSAFDAYGSVSNLLDITIPDSVKTIGDGAFYSHNRVRNITIGTGCTYIGNNAFGSNRVEGSLSLPNNIEYIGSGNFYNSMVSFDFSFPSALKELGESAFGFANLSTGIHDRNFLNEIVLPSIENIGTTALTPFFTNYLEIGNDIEEIGSAQCPSTTVYIGAEEPPTVMDIYVIDNLDKIEWLKTSLIYVPDNLVNKYKTTYGWSFLRQHIFPLSESANILNFAGNHKFCGLYPDTGEQIEPYYGDQKEQGVFVYGEYDGSTTLTSADTVSPPMILWVGDNVEYVDGNIGAYGTLGTGVVIFGTGLREFEFMHVHTMDCYDNTTYVFKTSTPPEFSCKNYQVHTRTKPDSTTETGVTISARNFVMYVPDNAVNTYKEWLRDNGVKQQLYKGSTKIDIDDYLVYPLSEFFNLSEYTKKRWVKVPGQYECSGTTKYVKEKEQTTNDYTNWTDTGRTRRGKKVIGYFSEDCGYVPYTGKFRATLSDGTTVELPCDGSNTLTENETSGMMETYDVEYVEIGTCVNTIGWNILRKKANVKAVKIPNTVTTIDTSVFNSCSGITWVNIPNSVTIIDAQAFQNCSGLTSITIPSTVSTVGWAAFANCFGLKELVVGSNTISDLAFTECWVLSSITMTSGVTSIGGGAFKYCGRLIHEMTVTIPNTVTSIGAEAFQECVSIRNITIPSGVTSIGDRAFGACSGLTSCTIGSGVTSIGNWAFSNCRSLTSITVEATTPPTLGGNAFYDTNDCPIFVLAGSLSSYQSAWSTYANRLQAIP